SITRHITHEQLAILTGYSAERLCMHLPDLRGLDHDVFSRYAGPACPRCTARHPGRPIARYYAYHAQACSRHRLWIGFGRPWEKRPGERFIDITCAPEVLAAQTRHRRIL